MATYGLETFSEQETDQGTNAVPKTSNTQNIPLQELNSTDILNELDFYFDFKGTANAFTGALTASTWFPYNTVANLKVPYQSNALNVGSMPGQLWKEINIMRKNNVRYQSTATLDDQKPVMSTGYSPQAQQGSAANYVPPAASGSVEYKFRLRVPTCLWFHRFYDRDAKGVLGAIDDVYVSPLFMQSIGRSIKPVLQLSPLSGATIDQSPFVPTGTQTTPFAWTDTGSNVSVYRQGWRQPSDPNSFPPTFNWAYNLQVDQVNLPTGKLTYVFPDNGQLLSVVFMLFDPTLNAGAGGPIPIANITEGDLTYGAGLYKFQDSPTTMQDRFIGQHGVLPSEGFWTWDLYADSRTNKDAINTYETAGVKAVLNFGTNVPGAKSYALIMTEWLTAVQ